MQSHHHFLDSIIEDRLRYFQDMQSYLNKASINNLDLNEYQIFFCDVLGVKLKQDKIMYQQILLELQDSIEYEIKRHNEFKECLIIKDATVRDLMLHLYIDKYTQESYQDRRKFKTTSDPIKKAMLVFHDNTYFKGFLNQINIDPAMLSSLSTVISIRNVKNSGTGFYLDWSHVKNELADLSFKYFPGEEKDGKVITKSKNIINGKLTQTHRSKTKIILHPGRFYSADFILSTNKMNSLFPQLDSLISRVDCEYGMQQQIKSDRSTYFDVSTLKSQVELFVYYFNFHKDFSGASHAFHRLEYRQAECANNYLKYSSKIKIMKIDLERNLTELDKLLNDLKINNYSAITLKKDIAAVVASVSNFNREWAERLSPEKFEQLFALTNEQLEEIFNRDERHYKTLKLQINSFKKAISEIISNEQQKKDEEIQKILEANLKLNADIQKKRDEMLLEAKNEIAKYKENIERLRAEKSAQNAIEEKSVVPQEINDTSKQINPKIESYLEKLREEDLFLIQDIYNLKRGLKYHDITNLIVNQLGGEVVEIGNGSSHKRIYLNNLYSEIYTHAGDESEGKSAKESVATGGMFKPHGKSHNSNELSFYNIKLIRETLVRASITPEKCIQAKEALSQLKQTQASITQIIR